MRCVKVVPPSPSAVCSKGSCLMLFLLCMQVLVAAGYWALCVPVGVCVHARACVRTCLCVCTLCTCTFCSFHRQFHFYSSLHVNGLGLPRAVH